MLFVRYTYLLYLIIPPPRSFTLFLNLSFLFLLLNFVSFLLPLVVVVVAIILIVHVVIYAFKLCKKFANTHLAAI